MRASAFDYHCPQTLDEAIALLGRHADDAKILAGGQSLIPAMASRFAQPRHVIDINKIADLERVTEFVGRLRIGPLARHNAFDRLAYGGVLRELLAAIGRRVGHEPIRLRGTVCGSLANADPASAWCTAAVALNAELMARSHDRGARTMSASNFFETIMQTVLGEDEMLVEVQIPLLNTNARWGFAEVARSAGHFPEALCVAVYDFDEDEMMNVRIGLGGVEAVPRRLSGAETVLERAQPTKRLFRQAADAAAAAIEPLDESYEAILARQDLVRAVVARALDMTLK